LRTNLYLDGALIEQPRNFFDMQFDVQRYEILRGPQGTLYGKASPAGTINVRTRRPNLNKVDGYVAGSVAQYDAFNTQFGVSVPIIKGKLAVRFAGVYDENEAADQKMILTGEQSSARTKSGRMTVLWQPTDDFEARLSTNYLDRSADIWANIQGAGYKLDSDAVNIDFPTNSQGRDKLTVLELTKELSDSLSLASITAYEDQTYLYNFDLDGTPAPQGIVFLTIGAEPIWQQDLRLMSEDNDFWDWQVGLFYGRRQSQFDVRQEQDLGFLQLRSTTLQTVKREESAIYTHNTLKITDELNVVVGLRYQQQNSSNHEPVYVNGAISIPDGINERVQNTNENALTGTVKVQYYFTQDLVGYASLDRANRAGSANADLYGSLPDEFAEIKSEDSNSMEFGLKGNFWKERGRFAVALYDQVYKNFQEDRSNIAQRGAIAPIPILVVNAKEAEIRGAEFTLGLLPTDNWELRSMVTFTDAKYNDFKDSPCSPTDGQPPPADPGYLTCDLSGERLPVTSRWAGNFASTYTLPLDSGFHWYAKGLLRTQSSQVDLLTRDTLGGYSTMDFITGLRGGEKNAWDVSLWVKNAFDRRAATSVFQRVSSPLPNQYTFADYDNVKVNPPRQIGVSGTYRF